MTNEHRTMLHLVVFQPTIISSSSLSRPVLVSISSRAKTLAAVKIVSTIRLSTATTICYNNRNRSNSPTPWNSSSTVNRIPSTAACSTRENTLTLRNTTATQVPATITTNQLSWWDKILHLPWPTTWSTTNSPKTGCSPSKRPFLALLSPTPIDYNNK